MRFWKTPLWVLLFCFYLVSGVGMALEKKATPKEEKGGIGLKGFGFTASHAPIDISSDSVEADQKKNTVTFKGNVVAKQEDITLYANTLVITYDPNTKQLKEITAIGNVKVVQRERRATGQKATFHQDENKVVLDGEAVVREGENVIRGEKITFYVNEERSVVEGGKGGRVTTHITPSSKEGKKK
ncbi:MAG: lipopolysaccharide transport periplasmic protein LptA [Thermodesulfobacteriota bacterium]